MKRLLITILFILGLSNFSTPKAQPLSLSHIVGLWISDGSTAHLVFFYDKENKLQLVEWDGKDCEEMEILKIEVKTAEVLTTERMSSTKFVTYNSYRLKSEDSLENVIKGDTQTVIYFKRLK